MDALTDGSAIATIATGVSAVTAAYVWTRGQVRSWRQEKTATKLRNWHGYIATNNIDTWLVRLADDPENPTAQVVLEVIDSSGNADIKLAGAMRQRILNDGRLSRSPTPTETEFLQHLQREHQYGQGVSIE